MDTFVLYPGQLTLNQVVNMYDKQVSLAVAPFANTQVTAASDVVSHYVKNNVLAYGVNTGFGKLANTVIPPDKLKALQKNLVLSHSAGVGEYLSPQIAKLILLLKINCLTQGFSGVRYELIDFLLKLYNANVIPCIPSKGSVGASGDLAPLAHMACVLIGEGEVYFNDKIVPAKKALNQIGLAALELGPKEGLALLNGTQVSCAIALDAFIQLQTLFDAALISGALSFIAANGDAVAFDERVHALRHLQGQMDVAAIMRLMFHGNFTQILTPKVQDPYSLRCQAQVMGACLEQCRYVASVLGSEINAITDNPLVFSESKEILSGGNFHGQAIAFAADCLAIVIATIGNITERRIALLMDPLFSGLPAFLVKESGLNSGFMLSQVTAAALASENKVLAHPASVDTIPTSANQEDHVSMATFAGRRLQEMHNNAATIVAIELIAASQAIDLFQPSNFSGPLQLIHRRIRHHIPFYDHDRFMASDIAKAKQLLDSREFVLLEQVGSNICAFF